MRYYLIISFCKGKYCSLSVMIEKLKYIGLFGLLFLGCVACAKEKNSPQECVRAYAQYVNQGKLEEAKKLCTPAAEAFLTALGDVISASQTTLDSSEIVIKSIQCHKQAADSVYCISIENDGFETYEKTYWLVQHNEKWLIDQPSAKGTLEKREEILEKK